MKKLTQETGGRVIEVGNKMDKLRDAFDQIAHELRSQYNIGYVPTNSQKTEPTAKWKSAPKTAITRCRPVAGITPWNISSKMRHGFTQISHR